MNAHRTFRILTGFSFCTEKSSRKESRRGESSTLRRARPENFTGCRKRKDGDRVFGRTATRTRPFSVFSSFFRKQGLGPGAGKYTVRTKKPGSIWKRTSETRLPVRLSERKPGTRWYAQTGTSPESVNGRVQEALGVLPKFQEQIKKGARHGSLLSAGRLRQTVDNVGPQLFQILFSQAGRHSFQRTESGERLQTPSPIFFLKPARTFSCTGISSPET